MIRMTLHTEREQGGVLDERFNATIRCTENIKNHVAVNVPLVQNILQTICAKINEAEDPDALNGYLLAVLRAVTHL